MTGEKSEMPRPRPPYLECNPNRHGKMRWYVRRSKRKGSKRIRIKHPVYMSEGFMAEYNAVVHGAPTMMSSFVSKDGKDTLGWLIKLYRKSRDWCELLSPGTRKQRGPIYNQVEESAGDIALANINRAKIEEGISARSSNQGRHFYNAMRQLFTWAVANELHDRNPTDGIKIKRTDRDGNDGHLAWPIERIEQFEERWKRGTKERLIFDVYLYVGVRRGDAARLGKQHMRHGIVHLMTEKSGGKMPIYVPVHPDLLASIRACPNKEGLAIIAKDDGSNYTKEALGNMFREAVERAGIPVTNRKTGVKGYSGHGLRKASATVAAESGYTESELNAMYGWSGHQMAQLYTKKADRKKLVARAFKKWTRPTSNDGLEYLDLESDKEVGDAV